MLFLVVLDRISHLGLTSGGNFGAKWPKTAWKLQNQYFRSKAVGGHGRENPIFWLVGGSPESHPLRETVLDLEKGTTSKYVKSFQGYKQEKNW